MDLAEHQKNLETLRETVESLATIAEGVVDAIGEAAQHPELREQLRGAIAVPVERIATASVIIGTLLYDRAQT